MIHRLLSCAPRARHGLLALALPLLLAACAAPQLREAQTHNAAGQYEAALAKLVQAEAERPDDLGVRAALARQREITVTWLASQVDAAQAAGRPADLLALADRIDAASPGHPRAAKLRADVERHARHARLLADARAALDKRQLDQAEPLLRQIVDEDPGHTAARALLASVADERADATRGQPLLASGARPVTLEFREAPLRTVFEALARAAGVNFVFDKDVRADQKVTLSLRDTTVDEAMRILLATQQLDRKLLNGNSVLIYPNNQQKQREHQELVTRSFYLINADVKQAQTLVRTMAKTRDIFIDERLNLMVVRDAPEVVRLIERLMAAVDIVEPEVVLDVEVLEIASGRLAELGLRWPSSVGYGLLNGNTVATNTVVTRADDDNLTAYIANPALAASLRGTSSNTNLLANPKIRARNREKARIQIGEKLPVFTTTSTANVGVSSSVSYVDVGLKLDVEPLVQLSGDVTIKVGLEVSNLVETVTGPQDSIAYRVGTRNATTSLRLKDGETQVLAGLIQDEDRRSAAGVPYLHEAPVLGRLFGVRTDQVGKTEVVLLITPRIVRNLELPAAAAADVYAGTDAQPGAESLRVNPRARVGAAPGRGGVAPAARSVPGGGPAADPVLVGPENVTAGAAFQVTVSNPGGQLLNTSLYFDAALFESRAPGATPGMVPLQIPPGGTRTFPFKARAEAAPGSSGTFSTASGGPQVVVTVREARTAAPAAPAAAPSAPPAVPAPVSPPDDPPPTDPGSGNDPVPGASVGDSDH